MPDDYNDEDPQDQQRLATMQRFSTMQAPAGGNNPMAGLQLPPGTGAGGAPPPQYLGNPYGHLQQNASSLNGGPAPQGMGQLSSGSGGGTPWGTPQPQPPPQVPGFVPQQFRPQVPPQMSPPQQWGPNQQNASSLNGGPPPQGMGQLNNGSGVGTPWGQSAPRQMQAPIPPPSNGPMGTLSNARPGISGTPWGTPAPPQGMPQPGQMQLRQPQIGGGGYAPPPRPMGGGYGPPPQQMNQPNQMNQQNIRRRMTGQGMGTPQQQQPAAPPPTGVASRRFGG